MGVGLKPGNEDAFCVRLVKSMPKDKLCHLLHEPRNGLKIWPKEMVTEEFGKTPNAHHGMVTGRQE